MTASRPNDSTKPEEPELDEVFLELVDRVMLQRKHADPFRREAAWRAAEEEARLRQLRLPVDDLVRRNPR